MNHETLPAQGPVDVNVRGLSYSYDLLYDIKTSEQLQNEVEYLAHRLGGIARLCRDDGYSIDEYVLTVMEFPNVEVSGLAPLAAEGQLDCRVGQHFGKDEGTL